MTDYRQQRAAARMKDHDEMPVHVRLFMHEYYGYVKPYTEYKVLKGNKLYRKRTYTKLSDLREQAKWARKSQALNNYGYEHPQAKGEF